MEWTTSLVVLTGLFELYPTIDNFHDIGTGNHVLDKVSWDKACHAGIGFLT
jgi:hypothetical protein